MDLFAGAERAMNMNARTWAKHANPWSVYSRILGGSLMFLALWSVYWIGWHAVAPIIAAVLWIWLNPRLFPPPKSAGSWAARAVLGERAFLNRKRISVPREHARAAWITTSFSLAFFALALYGFAKGDFWLALGGWHAATLAKLWFCDRMVWLWGDVKTLHPVYQAWARADWDADFGGAE